MHIYLFEWNETNQMHTHRFLMHPVPEARIAECIGQVSNSGKCIDLSHFLRKSNANLLAFYIHDRKTKPFAYVSEKI